MKNATRYGKLTEQAIALMRDVEATRTSIASFTDPDLSEQGIAQRRQAGLKALREQLPERVEALARKAESERSRFEEAFSAARPRLPQTADARMIAQQKWSQVKLLLDSGRPIQDLIKRADVDTALAIEEFAPSYLEARLPAPTGVMRHGEEPPHVDLAPLVENRLAELVGSDLATKLSDARESIRDHAMSAPYLQYLDHVARGIDRGDSRMAAAIESSYAAAAAEVTGVSQAAPAAAAAA
jgi:hypothetical protein